MTYVCISRKFASLQVSRSPGSFRHAYTLLSVSAASVTSHDVARLAGVSQATVSRALPRRRPRHRRHEAPRSRSGAGARLRAQRARSWLVDARRHGASRWSSSSRMRCTRCCWDRSTTSCSIMATAWCCSLSEATAPSPSGLLDRSVDGAVLMTTRLTSPLPSQLSARELPFVFLNRIGGLVDAPSVTADNVGGSRCRSRIAHRARAHERIAAIVGPEDTSTARDREAGFRVGPRRRRRGAADEAGVPSRVRPREWARRPRRPAGDRRPPDGRLLRQRLHRRWRAQPRHRTQRGCSRRTRRRRVRRPRHGRMAGIRIDHGAQPVA